MSTGIYGGDEVGAIALDVGSRSVRGGFAGEDLPKADFPTEVGCIMEDLNEDSDIDALKNRKNKFYIDTVNLKKARADMEVINFTKNSMIEDWDIFEKVVSYFYKSYVKSSPHLHPFIVSEHPLNPSNKRSKMAEIMFEVFNVPAFFISNTAVLSSFANGRSLSLVLDSGSSHTTATPIFDGFAIKHAVTSTKMGGNFLVEECKKFFEFEKIEIVPNYLVAKKQKVEENQKPIWEKKKYGKIKNSFFEMEKRYQIEDFIHNTVQIAESSIEEEMDSINCMESIPFHFPTGYNKKFHLDRFKLAECLFDTNYIRSDPSPHNVETVTQVVKSAINKCDIDLRPSLYNSILVVGGNSLLNGFSDRLTVDLANNSPATMKLKVNASQINVERKFSSWVGASILSSLGSFQQLWISKQEYEEMGSGCVDKKCY